jgi:lipoprotein-releasing system permease protein
VNLTLVLGLRYLRSKRASRFVSLISGFSILGVAIGVATLIVVLSVMDGFEEALKSRLARGEFHILITPAGKSDSQYFTLEDGRVASIYSSSSDVLSVNPVLKTEAILRAGKRVAGVSVRGISDAHMSTISSLLVEVAEGKSKQKFSEKNGMWLGKELAYQLNILPGDQVTVISPTETEGPMESVPRLRVFRVEGIFDSGIPEKDLHVAYSSIDSVSEFLGVGARVNQVEVQTRAFEDSPPIAIKIRELLGEDFTVRDWKDMNAHLFASLKLERITMFLILAMIILVASFNIVTSLTMLVAEKRKDIAILKAMGATRRQIGRIFLLQGAIIGNLGTLVGFIFGLGICLMLKRSDWIELPDIFYDRSLPVKITPLYIGIIVVTSVFIVLIASWFPARNAASVGPVDGLKNT